MKKERRHKIIDGNSVGMVVKLTHDERANYTICREGGSFITNVG